MRLCLPITQAVNDTAQGLPDLVPARMLNEFVYCPRLFFLEWVDGLWEENADTAQGELAHVRSDRGGGRFPKPDETEEDAWSGEARSILLDAPQLGMIARMDLVEGADGEVVPVDHKKGRPRRDGSPWEPEEIQLAAQVLILRENGYRCDRGYLSYRETRQRIEVKVDDDLEGRVREHLARLRETAAAKHPPPPLVDSPKCPRCSLVSICLPDETNAIRLARMRRPRRLIASRPDAVPMYVQEPGASVRLKGGRIEVRLDGELVGSARFVDVLEVALFGGASISEPALRALAVAGIPVTHFSFGGRFEALTVGVESSNVYLRIAQYRHADDAEASLELARLFVNAKIRNCRVLLRRNAEGKADEALRDLERLARRSLVVPSADALLGIEGAAARTYYRALPLTFGEHARSQGFDLDFVRRNRRPPRDRVNAVLSFLYALLTREAVLAARRVGFDPLLGFYHRPRFGRPALALDLMEEFRPLIADSVLLTLVNGRRLTSGDFLERGKAVTLTSPGRRAVIRAYERRLQAEIEHPVFRYKVSYRRALELQARLLAAYLLEDVPSYRPFVTR